MNKAVPSRNPHSDVKCLIVKLVEHFCDELNIQIRSGTDSMGREYKTDENARGHFYRLLEQRNIELADIIGKASVDAYSKGRIDLQDQLRALLGASRNEHFSG